MPHQGPPVNAIGAPVPLPSALARGRGTGENQRHPTREPLLILLEARTGEAENEPGGLLLLALGAVTCVWLVCGGRTRLA